MLRILGLVLLLVAGCGVPQQEAGQAPPGSVDEWTERMRQADSVRFEFQAIERFSGRYTFRTPA
jgi:hypothetical protein